MAPPPSPALPPPKTAAALIIGNELLTGKIADANIHVLACTLRDLGIELRRVVMVLDDVATIAHEVEALSATHDWVFTSGGVGPTHDDVTVAGVAQAFGVPIVEHPELAGMLREHYRERCTAGHLRMALVPEGATLEAHEDLRWPTIRVQNTWLLPGVPEIFRMKLAVVVDRLAGGIAFVSRSVFTNLDEGELKELLDRVVALFPDVSIGSYPKWKNPSYRTWLTFDGREPERVDAARDAFLASLPEEPDRTS